MLNKKGYTLIELTIFIIVGAIFLPTSFVAFTTVFNYFSSPDYVIKARFYADKKFAEFTRYPYSGSSLNAINETTYVKITASEDFYWKWKIKYVDPDNNFAELPNDTTPIPKYKVITVTIRSPDNSEFAMPLLITDRPKP